MRNLIRIFFVLPITVIVVMLAVANRHSVSLSFNPLAPENPATLFEVPLFWLVFACVAMGVVLGGTAVWFKQGSHRKAEREYRHEAEKWRLEADRHREKLAALAEEDHPASPSSQAMTRPPSKLRALPRNAA